MLNLNALLCASPEDVIIKQQERSIKKDSIDKKANTLVEAKLKTTSTNAEITKHIIEEINGKQNQADAKEKQYKEATK